MSNRLTEPTEKEMADYWKDVAMYLAHCHAATAYDYETRSASKSKKKRMLLILENCASAMDGQWYDPMSSTRTPESTRDRCKATAKRLQESLSATDSYRGD